jgi:hypothetical protein
VLGALAHVVQRLRDAGFVVGAAAVRCQRGDERGEAQTRFRRQALYLGKQTRREREREKERKKKNEERGKRERLREREQAIKANSRRRQTRSGGGGRNDEGRRATCP